MEANKTIMAVVLDDDKLTDEGKEASLLGMKGGGTSIGLSLLVPGSLDWLPSCAREHLTDRWYNVGT